ncbi:MAG: SIR2 family protein [Candidatus Scalindua sp.]|nr:SIR2 family protein [Candidatus Scalindua sp.]
MLIVGNGLGMAMNPDYFALQNGLESVWSNTDYLSMEHKALIQSAIAGTSEKRPPSSEQELDKLQYAIVAIEFLCEFEIHGVSWVSDDAKQLPSAFKKFIHEVALYFHRSDLKLPDSFIIPLAKFIHESKSHVATLNYDNLLYDAFTKNHVLDGYNGPLIDGFWSSSGFNEENLDRRKVNKHGWYLHLHGSPLYVGNEKTMRDARASLKPEKDSHIVLAHFEHKPLIIESSKILSAYWRHLALAFDESDKIILFGYSGLDRHLNNLIQRRNEKKLFIVEWQRTGEKKERDIFWKNLLSNEHLNLIQLENILDFADWE